MIFKNVEIESLKTLDVPAKWKFGCRLPVIFKPEQYFIVKDVCNACSVVSRIFALDFHQKWIVHVVWGIHGSNNLHCKRCSVAALVRKTSVCWTTAETWSLLGWWWSGGGTSTWTARRRWCLRSRSSKFFFLVKLWNSSFLLSLKACFGFGFSGLDVSLLSDDGSSSCPLFSLQCKIRVRLHWLLKSFPDQEQPLLS